MLRSRCSMRCLEGVNNLSDLRKETIKGMGLVD